MINKLIRKILFTPKIKIQRLKYKNGKFKLNYIFKLKTLGFTQKGLKKRQIGVY